MFSVVRAGGVVSVSALALRQDVRPGDRAAICEITQSSGFFTSAEVDIAVGVFDEFVADQGSGYEFVFADIDDQLVGYACWGLDEQTVSSFELYWIAVDQSHRKAGIGTALLHFVEEAISRPGTARLYIETAGREQYLPTRVFYEREGYERAAFLADYFSPGDARVIYVKRLS